MGKGFEELSAYKDYNATIFYTIVALIRKKF